MKTFPKGTRGRGALSRAADIFVVRMAKVALNIQRDLRTSVSVEDGRKESAGGINVVTRRRSRKTRQGHIRCSFMHSRCVIDARYILQKQKSNAGDNLQCAKNIEIASN